MKDTLPSKYDARYCPRCESKTRVINCKQHGAYFVRYRRCKECYYTFKTKEIIMEYENGVQEVEG